METEDQVRSNLENLSRAEIIEKVKNNDGSITEIDEYFFKISKHENSDITDEIVMLLQALEQNTWVSSLKFFQVVSTEATESDDEENYQETPFIVDSDKVIIALAKMLSQNQYLTRLHFYNYLLSADAVNSIYQALKAKPDKILGELTFFRALSAEDKGKTVAALNKLLEEDIKLTSLHIAGNDINDKILMVYGASWQ